MADVVNKFEIRLWNGQYYCNGKFQDGKTFELKSAEDLNYTQWKVLIDKAWTESQKPPVPIQCICPACKKSFVCPNNPNNIGVIT